MDLISSDLYSVIELYVAYQLRQFVLAVETTPTLTVLKASLNRAFRDGDVTSDIAWRTVKPYREADAVRNRYLSMDEIERLTSATTGDFGNLAMGALLTGSRYSELANLRAQDLNAANRSVYIRRSKSARARHVVLTAEGQRFFAPVAPSMPPRRRPGGRLARGRSSGADIRR